MHPLTRTIALLIAAMLVNVAASAQERVVSVLDHGAVADGKTLCTAPIQKAIDAAAGGGIVKFPPGVYRTGALRLGSGVTLDLDQGATLLGSRELKDYQLKPLDDQGRPTDGGPVNRNLLDARGQRDITLRGKGTIDGNGDAFRDKTMKFRPRNLYFENCRNITVEGIRLRAAGSWMQHYRLCEKVVIRGIDVFNHASFNNDGLDIDSCQDVTIAHCTIDSDDDAIVLKSLSPKPCRNITITDCTVASHCNALKLGTESGGGFIDISISHCNVASPAKSKVIYGDQRGLAAIALEIVDGGTLENVTVSDIKISGVLAPIFLRLGDRGRPYVKENPGVGTFRKVILKNITADHCSRLGCAIAGLPGHPIQDLLFENIDLSFDGGGTPQDAARPIDQRPAAYPECKMFGTLPAYAFYCRHVRGLALKNVKLRTNTPDLRPAIVLDDVQNVTLDKLDAQTSPGGPEAVHKVSPK